MKTGEPMLNCVTDIHGIAHPILGLIEVTQRCNLHCPVCFRAWANRPEQENPAYDPDFQEILERLQRLKKERKDIDPTIAFTGGEPTLRDDLPRLVYETHRLGFSRTEVITNGLRLAEDLSFCRELKKAGLSQLGFQFDGFNRAIYQILRGADLLETKMKALENIKKAGLPTILAVCVAMDINTHQLGEIIHYAIANKDFVEHINFQALALPVSQALGFGKENKVDLPTMSVLIETQTDGRIRAHDFYPPVKIKPVPAFIEAITGKPQMHLFPLFHHDCNLATYVYIDKKKKIIPVNDALHTEEFLNLLERLTRELETNRSPINKTRVIVELSFKMLALVRRPIFRKIMIQSIFKKSFDPLANLKKILMISCADYMDITTYREERNRCCGLFYLMPGNRVAPFCAYNVLGRNLPGGIVGGET